MLLLRIFVCAGLVTVVTCASAPAGVLPGDSLLIDDLIYSETYTVDTPARPGITYGIGYDTDNDPYYNVETTYQGLPSVQWRRTNAFSFHQGGVNAYLYTAAQNATNAGAATGLAQSGTGTWTLPNALGLHNVIIQTDAILTPSAGLQISCLPLDYDNPDANTWWSTGGLTVEFNWSGAIALITGKDPAVPNNAIWTESGFTSSIDNPWPLGPDPPADPDAIWHNVAVEFYKDASRLGIYVDEVHLGDVDLATIGIGPNEGIYRDFSMGAIGIGVRGLGWVDNTQIGALVNPLRPGDANGDGVVLFSDAAILRENWQTIGGANWWQGDFNGDGNVDDIDATIMAANWGTTAPTAAVPEPSTITLLLGGLVLLLLCRQRR